jgi:hypothetical protein
MSTANWSCHCPAITSSQAAEIAPSNLVGRRPSLPLARAAASFTIASARTKLGKWDMGMPVIWKLSMARAVCTP